jgi:tRNA-dihydrouridine synthase
MIKNPESASAVIAAAKRGAGDLPVSVKTRLGYNQDQLEEWLPHLLAQDVAAITLHARTRKEMSKVPARWERVKRAVEIRNEMGKDTFILGNGDALTLEDAERKISETGADGVMLGRAIFGNPWLFHPEKDLTNVSLEERLSVMLEHTRLFEELLPHKNFAIMKKHYKAYVNGFDGAKELRNELMECANSEEMAQKIALFLHTTAR